MTTSQVPWRDRSWCVHETVIGKNASFAVGSIADREFLSLGLAGEAGEFANLVKKHWRQEWGPDAPADLRSKMEEELADIAIYQWLLARTMGLYAEPYTVGGLVFDVRNFRERARRLCALSGAVLDPDLQPPIFDDIEAFKWHMSAIRGTIEELAWDLDFDLERECTRKEALVAQRYGSDVQSALARLEARA